MILSLPNPKVLIDQDDQRRPSMPSHPLIIELITFDHMFSPSLCHVTFIASHFLYFHDVTFYIMDGLVQPMSKLSIWTQFGVLTMPLLEIQTCP